MLRTVLFVLLGALLALPARAQEVTEIFKCKGRDGHWTYTNDRRQAEKQKCEVVTRQVNVAPATKAPPASRNARPGEFPKERATERARTSARDPGKGARHRAGRARQGAPGPRNAGGGAQRRGTQLRARAG